MTPSPTSPTSSNASLEDPEPKLQEPGLAELVTFFLASKRSLSSTTHVFRANEIVTAAREALEENAVLAATNAFVRRAISDQVNAVQAIHRGAETVSLETQDDFQAVIQACDEHSNQLNGAIEVLRKTSVETSLGTEPDTHKNLYDFMDESGVSDLHSAVRASIDRYNEAHGTFEDRIEDYGSAITDIKGSLFASIKPQELKTSDLAGRLSEGGAVGQNDMILSDDAASPLPSLFRNLEAHAAECAALLQSLVQNYDLCVTALKHTEGGGAAIEQVTGSLPAATDLPAGLNLKLETIEQDAPPQPMFEEERADMLAVLSKDAAEVEDVVREIGERLADMEEQYSHIDSYISSLRVAAQKLHATLKRLAGMVEGIDDYLVATSTFMRFWSDEKQHLIQKQEEFEALRELYENFSLAYDSLVLEMHRRRSVQVTMDKIVRDTQRKLEELRHDDMDERQAWSAEWGEFLPSDIWAGIGDPPSRYDVQRVESLQDVPKIAKETLERARRRLNVPGSGKAAGGKKTVDRR